MSSVDGRRWAVVVFGPPAFLIILALVGYGLVFVVPGGPCHGAGDLSAPQSEIAIAANDSAVAATHVGGDPLESETTDRVVLFVQKPGTDTTAATDWSVDESVGSSVTLTESEAGFSFEDRDIVAVRWYGTDPGVAGFCPNGQTMRSIAGTDIGNASALIELS